MTKHTAQDELLKNAQFYPIFGPDGNIEGISQLSVATDRRLGVQAVEELIDDHQPDDHIVTSAGWTLKQARILKSAAPHAAHYLKPSRKYDAATGEMVPSMTILLPYEVVWRLFELLFEGQYSIEVNNILTDSEDVLPLQGGGIKVQQGDKAMGDDAPGRIFYSRAEVTITLHLANGSEKRYTGVGIAYDHVRLHKTGNVYAITSSRRTAEKGAVSDAKREAISTIGRVFRRAFEDGDDMVQKFQELLLQELRKNNKPEKAARASDAAAAKTPAPRKAEAATKAPAAQNIPAPAKAADKDTIPDSAAWASGDAAKAKEARPADNAKAAPKPTNKPDEGAKAASKSTGKPDEDAKAEPKSTGKAAAKGPQKSKGDAESKAQKPYTLHLSKDQSESIEDPDQYYEKVSDLLANCEDIDATTAILDANANELRRAEGQGQHGMTLDALREMALGSIEELQDDAGKQSEEQSGEDTEEDEDDRSATDWSFTVPKLTGDEILKGYKDAFKKAKTMADINAILEDNTDLAKRLTKSQKGMLLEATSKAKTKL